MLENRSIFGKPVRAIAIIGLMLVSALTVGANTVVPMASAATCESAAIASVLTSGYETVNPPTNAIDDSLRTRWSSEGFGSWIRADLGEQQTVCSVDIAWYRGDERANSFVIAVSDDGSSYTDVYSGKSSGETTGWERYSFSESAARYVKITVTDIDSGNGEWVSVSEIGVNAYAAASDNTDNDTTDNTAVSDTRDPTIEIAQPEANSDVAVDDGNVVVSGTSSDRDSGVKEVGVRIDSDRYTTATPKAPGDWSTWSVTLPASAGEHRLVSRATDNAGNQDWDTMYVTFVEQGIVDTTQPSIAITNPAEDSAVSIAGSTIAIQGTASDSGSGINKIEVRIDDGSYSLATPKAPGDWSTWSISMPITPGERRIVPRATDNAGNQAWNSIYVTAAIPTPSSDDRNEGGNDGTSSALDDFGIKKIYPTAQGGNEWYVDMDDPYSDPLLQNRETLTKQSDGSWQVSGGSNGQVRLEAWSPVNEKWLNVEITEYAKMVSGSNELLQLYSRGGHHSTSNECLGSAVKARLYGDGEARWVKEINHPAYTSNRGSVEVTDEPLKGRWIGFKAVIYNFVEDGKTYVRMESYIDDDVTDSNGNLVVKNNWKLASVVEDRGGWASTDSDFNSSCAPLNKDSNEQNRQRDEILNMPGGTSTQNIAAFRSDDLTWNFKYLSVREIQAP